MSEPIPVRLDDDERAGLQAQAGKRGTGPITLPRDHAARDAQRARIREASEAIGRRVASDKKARAFYEEIGTPTTNPGS